MIRVAPRALRALGAFTFAFAFGFAAAGCHAPATVDEPAANLDVAFTVLDDDPAPPDGNVVVDAAFSLAGAAVDLDSTTTVTCNGVALAGSGILGYAARVPLVAPGAGYAFVFARSGVTTTVTAIAASRPVVTAPTSGATVTRSTTVSLMYAAGHGTSVRGSASSGSSAVSGIGEPDTGTYTGLDVTSLVGGAGAVGVARTTDSTLTGSGYKSATMSIVTGSVDVPVTWD